jgi:hypothetical protein
MRRADPGRGVDPEHHPQPPAPGDGIVVTERAVAGDHLRHHPDSEQNQNQRARELGTQLPEKGPPG